MEDVHNEKFNYADFLEFCVLIIDITYIVWDGYTDNNTLLKCILN